MGLSENSVSSIPIYIYIFFTSTLKTAICGYPVFTRLNGYTNHLIINLAVCEQCWIMIGI